MFPFNDDVHWKVFVSSATVFSSWATVGAAVVAIGSATLIFIQIWVASRASRSTLALEAHRDYLKLCIERPELSSSQAMLIHLGRGNFTGILKPPLAIETERALWFLSYLLNTLEQLVETTGSLGRRDREWTAVIKAQVEYNEELMREVWPEWSSHYAPPPRRLVAETLPGIRE